MPFGRVTGQEATAAWVRGAAEASPGVPDGGLGSTLPFPAPAQAVSNIDIRSHADKRAFKFMIPGM